MNGRNVQLRLLERGRSATAARTAGVVTTTMSITVDIPSGPRLASAEEWYGRTWKRLAGPARAAPRTGAAPSPGAGPAPPGRPPRPAGAPPPQPLPPPSARAAAAPPRPAAVPRPAVEPGAGAGCAPDGARSAPPRRAGSPVPTAARRASPRAARASIWPEHTGRPGLRARRGRLRRPPRDRAAGRAPPPGRPRRSTAKRSPHVLPIPQQG